MNGRIFHPTGKLYPVLGAVLLMTQFNPNPALAQEAADTLVWGLDSGTDWETTMNYGEDLIVDIELPSTTAIAGKAAGARTGSMVWSWRGLAVINDDNSDSDPDQAWHEHMRLADTSESSRTDAAAAPVRSSGKWIAVNLETGFEYEVELSDQLARSFRVYMEQTGQHQAHTGSAAGGREPRLELSQEGSAPALTKGWSNGMDTRTRRFDNTTYPYRTLGQLGGGRTSGCSGTLIGPRLVLTAARCIWVLYTDSWVSAAGARCRPGREGTGNIAACEAEGGFKRRG
jgi:V8-like Glu-specific endopeptidase